MERVDLLSNGTPPIETWDTSKTVVIDPSEWDSREITQFFKPESIPLGDVDSAKALIFENFFSARFSEVERTKRSLPSLWLAPTRDYLISFGWLAFYVVVSTAAASLSAYSLTHRDYLFLPAAVFTFVSFTVLALIRLRVHLIEHRHLSGADDEYNLRKAA
jgi:hypothetical protein